MIVSSFGSTLILPLMWPSFLKNSKNVSKISLFSPQYIALILFVQWCSSQWWCTKRKPIFFKYWDLCFGTKKDLKSRFTSFELFQLLVFSSLIEFWLNIKFPSGELSLDKLWEKIIFAAGTSQKSNLNINSYPKVMMFVCTMWWPFGSSSLWA